MTQSDDYWEGALWVYHASITNDAMDVATHTYTITVGAGNELEILFGSVLQGDTSNRAVTVEITDGTNRLAVLIGSTVNAGVRAAFPTATPFIAAGPILISAGTRIILGGAMELVVTIGAVAVSQDSALGLVCRIRGAVPTVVEAASAGTPVISIDTEQVF